MSYRTFLCIMLLVMFAGCSEHKPAGPPKASGTAEPTSDPKNQ